MTTPNKATWNDSLKVGNSDIDGQHQLLVELINSLFDVVINNLNTGPKKMEELDHYVQYHIKCEENILSKIKYADLNNHQMAHTELTSLVSDVINRLLYLPSVDEQVELINTLQTFWVDHIKNFDHKFKIHINNNSSQQNKSKHAA